MALEIRTTKTTQPKAHPPESELGFGKHFSDHALIITWTEGRVAEWQPKASERRFDEIGWTKDIRTAMQLAQKN